MTSHVSVFYSTVIVVVRTINMLWPFYKTKNSVLKICFVMYALIWFVITILDIFYAGTDPMKIGGMVLLPMGGSQLILALMESDNKTLNSSTKSVYHDNTYFTLCGVLCIVIPFVIPAILCTICFFLQVSVLLRKGGTHNAVNMRITITILYLTGVFFICNTAFFRL